jgi:hypothetical protein
MTRVGWVSFGVFTLCTATALAQNDGATGNAAFPTEAAPAPAPQAAATSAPDVVILKDGGMVRGTIAELVAGDHVTILTLTGATKTFNMGEVRYAGTASGAPSATTEAPRDAPARSRSSFGTTHDDSSRTHPLITVHAAEARLTLRSDEPAVTFHVNTASATTEGVGTFWGTRSSGVGTYSATVVGYDRICTAPCEASMAAGTYTLALSSGDSKSPVPTEAPITLPSGASTLKGHYESNAGLRGVGWAAMIGGPLLGLGLMFATQEKHCDGGDAQFGVQPICYNSFSSTGLALGLGFSLTGLLAGVILINVRDVAEITVVPGSGASVGDARASLLTASNGARLRARF